jgi:hypothetical protein
MDSTERRRKREANDWPRELVVAGVRLPLTRAEVDMITDALNAEAHRLREADFSDDGLRFALQTARRLIYFFRTSRWPVEEQRFIDRRVERLHRDETIDSATSFAAAKFAGARSRAQSERSAQRSAERNAVAKEA